MVTIWADRILAVGVLSMHLTLAGCAPRTATESPPPAEAAAVTLHQYVADNGIAETPVRRGDPGTPTVKFAAPPGWRNAGDRTPDWAYGAIIYDAPKNSADPPYMIAIASKLAGDIDVAKVLEYAPGQLNGLPDFAARGKPTTSSLGGHQAVDYVGTFLGGGETKSIGQVTIAVPGGPGEVFVYQLNAVAPPGEEQVVIDAVKRITTDTRITPP